MSDPPSSPDYEAGGLRWFTVTGAPRSGTTMLGRLLNTHPAVGCLHEVALPGLLARIDPFFAEAKARHEQRERFRPRGAEILAALDRGAGGSTDLPGPATLYRAALHNHERDRRSAEGGRLAGALDGARHAAQVARMLVGIAFDKRDLCCIGTKVPNLDPVEAARGVATALPNLRLLHIVRRPSDVVNSSIGRRGLTRAGIDDWHVQTVAEACNEWRTNWNYIASAQRQLGPRFLAVKYEDLVAGRADVVDAITDHLGIPRGVDTSICRRLPDEFKHYAFEPAEKAGVERVFGFIESEWEQPLGTLLARFPTIAFPSPSDGVIDFTEAGDGQLLNGGGLCRPESWGTWTSGEVARIDVALDDGPRDIELAMDVQVWRRDISRPFRADLQVGAWRRAIVIEAGSPGPVSRIQATIPRSALLERSRLHLLLHVVEPKRAADSPVADNRAIGLGLCRLSVRS